MQHRLTVCGTLPKESIPSVSGITVEDVAERLHLNRSYFSTLFRSAVGKSPREYLTALRMERAAMLLTRYGHSGSRKLDGMHPDRPVGFNSPFIFRNEKGEYKFDLNKYFAVNNNGKVPDAVSFQLGLNDFFLCTDENIAEVTAKSLQDMEKLIAEFRKLTPAPAIFIFQHIPGSNQDGFGASYGCQQSTWQYRKNLDYYNRALAAKAKELGLRTVPVYMNFDTENNYPVITAPVNQDNSNLITRQNNGVHPSIAGYNQMGDTLYCAVKALLAEPK